MAHFSAPDKDPVVRMRMIREAGELEIPFTTGILIGIGETLEERVDILLSLGDRKCFATARRDQKDLRCVIVFGIRISIAIFLG